MFRTASLCCALTASCALIAVFPALAQNPHSQTPDLAEGARLFASNCTVCHGADAKGGRGPSLVSGKWKHGSSAAEIAKNIHDGIPGTEMPAFPLPGDQTRSVAEWLLSLNRGSDDGSPAMQPGAEVFFGAAAARDAIQSTVREGLWPRPY